MDSGSSRVGVGFLWSILVVRATCDYSGGSTIHVEVNRTRRLVAQQVTGSAAFGGCADWWVDPER